MFRIKNEYEGLMVHLQRYKNQMKKCHLTWYIGLNAMKLIYIIQICKSIFLIRNAVNGINISCTWSYERFRIRFIWEMAESVI